MPRQARGAGMPGPEPIEIVRLGAQGDGVVEGNAGDATADPLFVPFALPGERWRRTGDGDFERLSDAPGRVSAPCPHFGSCGGCVAQHMGDALYAEWKTDLVRQAFAHQGITVEPRGMWRAPAASRRRVTLAAETGEAGVRLGFRAARSHDLVEISSCTIAVAPIVDALPALAAIVTDMVVAGSLPRDVRVHVFAAGNGLDVWVSGIVRDLAASERGELAARAERSGFVRLVVDRDEIFQRARPVLQIAGVDLAVPPGAFVQAVAAAEAHMAETITRALGRARTVADLFCGLGSFTLPIARKARVTAVDNAVDAMAALDEAVRHARGLKPVEGLRRDLFREPLSRNELNPFDAVVFDPPRAGAVAQCEALARSKVPCVVAVSCNPATMARDLRLLLDGGYKLQSLEPIDQFLYSAHVEAVAVLRR